MIEIFRGSNIESMNIRNLLESRNIHVFVINELMSSIEPWVVSPGGNNPTILKVNEQDYKNALDVIEEYNSNSLNL